MSIDGGVPISTSLTEKESFVLRELARGQRVIEVGAAFGFSTIILAQVATHVTSIDPHDQLNSRETHTHNLEHYAIPEDRVSAIQGYSQSVLPELPDRSASFVFIDGDHSMAAVVRDVNEAIRLIDFGGYVAAHDYDEDTCPGVRPACDALLPGGALIDTLWVWQKQ